MKIEIYKSEYKEIWDNFVTNSKNGTFLFYRDFIEYHGSRFNDYSLLFYDGDCLLALMPGHIEDSVFYTHKGLTYGGLVMSQSLTAAAVLEIFRHLLLTFKQQGLDKVVYKAIPHIYHSVPAEEDLYALFYCKAQLTSRSISSAIVLPNTVSYSDSRIRGLRKAEKSNLKIEKSDDWSNFWTILTVNLRERYGTRPVHSLSEIKYLKLRFPDNIFLYTVLDIDDCILAGCVLFETQTLVHVQYTASTELGKNSGAIDILIDYIIKLYTNKGKKYFDYGISTEESGTLLNENLIYQKEGFGGRGIVYDIYTIDMLSGDKI